MQNLFVPLRRAWDLYARNTLRINPRWIISSGYRPTAYNKKIGGSKTSAHRFGYAIDVQLEQFVGSSSAKRTGAAYLSGFLKSFLTKNRNINFDQILVEYKGHSVATSSTSWIHIAYKNSSGQCRRQFYWSFSATNGGKGAVREIL